ncbi:DNA-directed RNA polymerases I [Karstenula rhodostoma CBS 690.94]|uniref:DNA-directed RNA polymerases I, II, and III subunit RPABC1 n=1 Tax=Karstenula rhodostoma CBS 690.94 TaxID=1392251 RepID=A0A9P4UBS1_9PLEO|nr:DNA-directed RNA polymerases I [Karstenula rhodostoma CBS 690.94]
MAESDHKARQEMLDMWRIYRTTKEMCRDRGYNVLPEECSISFDDFARKFGTESGAIARGQMNFSAIPSEDMVRKYTPPATPKVPNPEAAIGTLWVEFNADENIGMKNLREFIHHLLNGSYYSGIMIVVKPLSGMAMRGIRGASALNGGNGPKGGIEVFLEQDLKINITKHELVPTHLLLSTEEKAQLLKRYRLKETQLPRIQVTDPVAKYYGLRRGQVVKIIRKSETAGRYASYRWAI